MGPEEEDEEEAEDTLWVMCDLKECGKWYHQTCVDTNWPDNFIVPKKKWYCCG